MLYGGDSESYFDNEQRQTAAADELAANGQHQEAPISEATLQPANDQSHDTSIIAQQTVLLSSSDGPNDAVAATDNFGGHDAGSFDIEEWIDPSYLGR